MQSLQLPRDLPKAQQLSCRAFIVDEPGAVVPGLSPAPASKLQQHNTQRAPQCRRYGALAKHAKQCAPYEMHVMPIARQVSYRGYTAAKLGVTMRGTCLEPGCRSLLLEHVLAPPCKLHGVPSARAERERAWCRRRRPPYSSRLHGAIE